MHQRTGGCAPPHVSLPLHLYTIGVSGVSGERYAPAVQRYGVQPKWYEGCATGEAPKCPGVIRAIHLMHDARYTPYLHTIWVAPHTFAPQVHIAHLIHLIHLWCKGVKVVKRVEVHIRQSFGASGSFANPLGSPKEGNGVEVSAAVGLQRCKVACTSSQS